MGTEWSLSPKGPWRLMPNPPFLSGEPGHTAAAGVHPGSAAESSRGPGAPAWAPAPPSPLCQHTVKLPRERLQVSS